MKDNLKVELLTLRTHHQGWPLVPGPSARKPLVKSLLTEWCQDPFYSHLALFISHFPLGTETILGGAKSLQSCLTLFDPMDCSLPGSSVLPVKNTGVGCHFLLQRILPTQGLNLVSLMSPALTGGFFTASATWEATTLQVL